jgi:hypothetical protein
MPRLASNRKDTAGGQGGESGGRKGRMAAGGA